MRMKKVLVLIDWHNLFKSCENKFSLNAVFGEINEMIRQIGTLKETRLFVPNYQLASPWKLLNSLQTRFGLAIEACPVLREGQEAGEEMRDLYKDLVDLEIFRWIINYVQPGSGPDMVVFVSGDSHFIAAANEVKRRGKDVAFWVVDPEATSQTILQNMPVNIVKIAGKNFLSPGENKFLQVLDRATKGEMTEKDKHVLDVLREAAQILAEPEKPLTLAEKIAYLASQMKGGDINEALEAIKTLLTVGAGRIDILPSPKFNADPLSRVIRWLKNQD